MLQERVAKYNITKPLIRPKKILLLNHKNTMDKEEQNPSIPPPPPEPPSTQANPPPPPPPPPPPFDPSRMIGIIKRKALIKELAAVYHAECLTYCQELLELQKKSQEPFIDLKTPDDLRKETMRPPKRLKKSR